MVKELIEGTYRQTNLRNESAEYLAKREEVRLAEIELMRARERVAELRRALSAGTRVRTATGSDRIKAQVCLQSHSAELV